MIFTRHSLRPFVGIDSIASHELIERLGGIGLEVESFTQNIAPHNVVVGRVLEVRQHPNADKLRVCQVDVGEKALQIVCGARNVAAGQVVPVALVGAVVNGKTIAKTALRGIESEGMICSSTELGFPKVNDGILVLDLSVGELHLGTELCSYPLFNDEVFEISITPNRGDCLCLFGIAREIAVAFSLELKETLREMSQSDHLIGIGRLLQLRTERNLSSSLLYTMIQCEYVQLPLSFALILARNEMLHDNALINLTRYATLVTGTIFSLYSASVCGDDRKVELHVRTDNLGLDSVFAQNKLLSRIGIYQMPDTLPSQDKGLWILEASYIPPTNVIAQYVEASKKMSKELFEKECPKDAQLYYRSSRGSNPQLLENTQFFIHLLQQVGVTVYSGSHEFIQTPSAPTISININQTNQIIGTDVSVVQIVNVLRKLGFSVEVASDEQFLALKAPIFRHDIVNKQDVAEEILRIYGIDRIATVPLRLHEQRSLGEHYFKYHFARTLAARARSVGFSETIHFIFNQSSRLRDLGFTSLSPMQDLQNPITEELNTLRPTLLLSLLDTMLFNLRNGKKAVNLFEIGSIFDAQRNERVCMAFVSNAIMREARYPASKDNVYTIYGFAEALSQVIGAFSLEMLKDTSVQLFHPAQSAHIIQNGAIIGTLATLHPALNARFETDIAFVAEIELSLLQQSSPHFVPFSKMQKSQRDLSVLISDSIPFVAIRNAIKALAIAEIRELYPLDIYRDNKMPQNQQSLTIRLILQSEDKNLDELGINDIMQKVLQVLQQQFGAVLR